MIPHHRRSFNAGFSEKSYADYVNELNSCGNHQLDFRVAETPVFLPSSIRDKMLEAGETILDFIASGSFQTLTRKSLPGFLQTPLRSDWPDMIVLDFGICKDSNGNTEPKLIELQGFPSLFAFEYFQDLLLRKHFNIPDTVSSYLNGYDAGTYLQLLKDIIIGDENPEHVILLELFPEKQKTRIDFELTKKLLGISVVCVSNLLVESNNLYYLNEGIKTPVRRIYNRVIFDDWQQHTELFSFNPGKDYNVTWIPEPQWYYRISKYLLPFLEGPSIPKTYFLDELTMPLPLDQFVLKPLFSYAGSGVILNPDRDSLDEIHDPENWILQEKQEYANIIETPDEPAKIEVRLFYFKKKEWSRPKAIHNLARISKGQMIGTRYNQNKTWVGGTIAYFEKLPESSRQGS